MSEPNLMQAIAHVKRVFREKEGGLIVDYVSIASTFKQAMREDSQREQINYGKRHRLAKKGSRLSRHAPHRQKPPIPTRKNGIRDKNGY